MKKIFCLICLICLIRPICVYAGPTSTTFELKQYGFNSGGTENSDSTTFSLFGVSGEPDLGNANSSTYQSQPGLSYTLTSNVPPAPTLTNPSNFYNKLKLVLNTGGNPTDSTFAIAISTDFSNPTLTKYIQTDSTVSTVPAWQTYTQWGGATGFNIVGLSANTTYFVKISAKQGKFTQSPFGPAASASTVPITLGFSLSPSSINLGVLTPATVVVGVTKINLTINTNGTSGAIVYLSDTNIGLNSPSQSYTINSGNNDLAAILEGYGVRGVSVSQTSGGPMEILPPYNGASNNVGIVDTSKRIIFDSSNAAVNTGLASFEIQAKSKSTTPAASDYADTISVIISAVY